MSDIAHPAMYTAARLVPLSTSGYDGTAAIVAIISSCTVLCSVCRMPNPGEGPRGWYGPGVSMVDPV